MTAIKSLITDTDPRYVYTFWAADGACLYVGCTARLGNRLNAHITQRDWWEDVARVEVAVHPDRAAGEAAEQDTIRLLQPTHNRVFTEHNTSGRESWETRRRNQQLAAKATA